MQTAVPPITKTDYLSWRKCPATAWITLHEPHRIPEPTASQRRKEADGNAVELLARGLFPDGVLIGSMDVLEAANETALAIAAGARTIFQATVITADGMAARADVLQRDATGWHLIEIKSSAADPSNPRDISKRYLPDITFQVAAFRSARIHVSRCSLMFIRKGFRRDGHIWLSELFAQTDLTPAVESALPEMRASMRLAAADLSGIEAPPCNCHRTTRSNRCDLFAELHPEVPHTGTIYQITGIHKRSLLPALDRGIMHIRDWPEDIALTPSQRRQVELARSGQPTIDRRALRTFLSRMVEPLWFLDYETFQQPIPRWDGYAPHQQIPFQYSLHRYTAANGLRHFAHLNASGVDDPVPNLVGQLRADLSDEGTVIVWNQGFEQQRNVEMARHAPDHAPFLLNLNDRMIDLAHAVSKGIWCHPDFNGSWSLKTVVPVVSPDLAYDHLEIGNGSDASERWMRAVIDDPSPLTEAERAATLDALHAYCHHDTIAMVRIWEHLHRLLQD